MALSVSDANFGAEVLQSDKPVLVKFWAVWCGPCRQLAPTVDELACEFAVRLTVVGVNIDENPETTKAYDIRGIPTLVLFRNGKPVGQRVGSLPKASLKQWLEGHLESTPGAP
jgi:thioredoxin 1